MANRKEILVSVVTRTFAVGQYFLEKNGFVSPFLVVATLDGQTEEVELHGLTPEARHQIPLPSQVIERARAELEQAVDGGEFAASALGYTGQAVHPTNGTPAEAICVLVYLGDGNRRTFTQCYSLKASKFVATADPAYEHGDARHLCPYKG